VRRGFWYDHRTGEFKDAIFESHLRVVMDDPPLFGVTREFIDAEFAQTREEVGLEGVARRNILMGVLEHSSWVRWREMQPPLYSHRWSVEAWSKGRWNPTEEDLLKVLEEWVGDGRSGSERFSLEFLGQFEEVRTV
jgi:hypothetical protein